MTPSIGIMLGLANAGQSAPFTPQSVSNLVAMFDASLASSVTLNVADVASINDLSGNSRTASQGTAAEQPAYNTATGINSKNVITFTSANNDSLSLANSLGIDRAKPGFTYAGVIRLPNLSGTRRVFSIFTSGGNTLFNIECTVTTGVIAANTRRVAADTLDTKSSVAALVANVASFVAVSVNYSTGAVFIQIDGTTRSQTAAWTVGALSEDVNHSAGPTLGRVAGVTFAGDMGEILLYDRALTTAEISDLRTRYLKPKFALA